MIQNQSKYDKHTHTEESLNRIFKRKKRKHQQKKLNQISSDDELWKRQCWWRWWKTFAKKRCIFFQNIFIFHIKFTFWQFQFQFFLFWFHNVFYYFFFNKHKNLTPKNLMIYIFFWCYFFISNKIIIYKLYICLLAMTIFKCN